jgi:RHS repeat-associated protein
VLSVTYNGGGLSYTQSFGYDALNRLTTSQENGGASWSQTNSYDRYGNRSIVGGSLSFNTSDNRITGWSYDAAGNLLNDGLHNYTFDAENRIKNVDGNAAYTYDAEGHRIKKSVGENVRFVYGIGGKLVAELESTSGALKKEYIYGVSGLLATIVPNAQSGNGTQYPTNDSLGSPRVVTNSSAGVISRHDYMPFGEEIGSGVGGRTTGMGYGTADGIRKKFTGYERDSETGLDYAQARFFSSTQGRFTSTDPLMASARAIDPQTWNRFSYVANNPLKLVDPSGLSAQLGGRNISNWNGAMATEQATEGISPWPDVPVEQTAENIDSGNALDSVAPASSDSGTLTGTVIDPQNPQEAITNNATPEQADLLVSGAAEAARRMQVGQCRDFFGDRGLATFRGIAWTVNPNLPADGHPQAVSGPGTIVQVNPNGGLLTPDGSSRTFNLVDSQNSKNVFRVTLTGVIARAFGKAHEGGHQARRFGKTDRDDYPKHLLNNYKNNYKIWKACFSEIAPVRWTGSGLPPP